MGVHSCGKNKLSSRPVGEIKVWIKPFQRFAGAQGSALSRTPQSPKFPFETRGSARVSTKLSFQAPPAGGKTLLRAKRAHENQPADWFSILPLSFDSRTVGRTGDSPSKGNEGQRMGNPWFLTLWEPVFLPHQSYREPPIGWESTNSAQRVRAVRRSLLCWGYEVKVYFMGQLRAKYRFCAVWALRAAV